MVERYIRWVLGLPVGAGLCGIVSVPDGEGQSSRRRW